MPALRRASLVIARPSIILAWLSRLVRVFMFCKFVKLFKSFELFGRHGFRAIPQVNQVRVFGFFFGCHTPQSPSQSLPNISSCCLALALWKSTSPKGMQDECKNGTPLNVS